MVTRRDFLNGIALTIGAGLTPASLGFAFAANGTPYPPALTGLRGSHDGAFQNAHRVAREGEKFGIAALPVSETYDLVVVGGGIAGLSAAYFYRQKNPGAKILVVDNHDDFGGHAKRNEFTIGGAWRIGYGGSETFQSPHSEWSKVALRLVRELGIEITRFEREQVFHRNLYPDLGLSRAVWFNKEDFGTDKLVTGDPTPVVDDDIPPGKTNARPPADFIADLPVSAEAKAAIARLYDGKSNYLEATPQDQRAGVLAKISYSAFLKDKCGLPQDAINAFQKRSHDFFGAGIDTISAASAKEAGYPGFGGLGLKEADDGSNELNDAYVHHFPDGNASLARLLVKALIPSVTPAALNMDGIVRAKFDYSKLDQADQKVRIRVSTTAMRVENKAGGVDVGLLTGSTLTRVRSKHAILACNASVIPWICPELPDAQRTTLSSNVRMPLVYTNVAIRNWQSFVALKTHLITAPMAAFSLVKLDYPVSLGGYKFPKSPDEPMLLHMVQVPVDRNDGGSARDQARAARLRLLEKPFSAYESEIRDQLQRMLSAGGFDENGDIAGITVNRWSHGYSSSYDTLIDGEEADFKKRAQVARAPKGNIALGSSDTGWDAYAHVAIREAHRAIQDLSRA